MRFLPISLPAADMYLPAQPTRTKLSRNTEYAGGFIWLCAAFSGVILFIKAATIRYPKEITWTNEHC